MEFSQSLSNIINSFEAANESVSASTSSYSTTELTMMMMANHDAFEPTPFRDDHCHHRDTTNATTSNESLAANNSSCMSSTYQPDLIMRNDHTSATTATAARSSTSAQRIIESVSRILNQQGDIDNTSYNNGTGLQGYLSQPGFMSAAYGERRNHNKLEQWSKFHLSAMMMNPPFAGVAASTTGDNAADVRPFPSRTDNEQGQEESIVMEATGSADEVMSSPAASDVLLGGSANMFTTANEDGTSIFEGDVDVGNDKQKAEKILSNFPPCYTVHQAERWQQRFKELVDFKAEYGHCCVPSHWPQNAPLAQWVKRQRSQYKLKTEDKRSNMTDSRQKALEDLGFVWDSHAAFWEERLNELRAFRERHGHCNVPTKYLENQQLAIWAKCQRRQFKLYSQGHRHSNMTMERIGKLSELGFVFCPRALKKKKSKTSM